MAQWLIFHHIDFVTSQFSTHHLTPPEGSRHHPHRPERSRQLLSYRQVRKPRPGKLNGLLRGSHTSSRTPESGHLATQHGVQVLGGTQAPPLSGQWLGSAGQEASELSRTLGSGGSRGPAG